MKNEIKYVLNEENIDFITCIDPPAAEMIWYLYINIRIYAQGTADELLCLKLSNACISKVI